MQRQTTFPPRTQAATVEAANGLCVRLAPCPSAPVLARAACGAALTVLNRHGPWFAVRCADGRGYVRADDIVLLRADCTEAP